MIPRLERQRWCVRPQVRSSRFAESSCPPGTSSANRLGKVRSSVVRSEAKSESTFSSVARSFLSCLTRATVCCRSSGDSDLIVAESWLRSALSALLLAWASRHFSSSWSRRSSCSSCDERFRRRRISRTASGWSADEFDVDHRRASPKPVISGRSFLRGGGAASKAAPPRPRSGHRRRKPSSNCGKCRGRCRWIRIPYARGEPFITNAEWPPRDAGSPTRARGTVPFFIRDRRRLVFFPGVGYLVVRLRHWRDDRVAEGARLLSECGGYTPPRVRIPLSPLVIAPIAQLDRAPVYGTGGRRFESFWARSRWGSVWSRSVFLSRRVLDRADG